MTIVVQSISTSLKDLVQDGSVRIQDPGMIIIKVLKLSLKRHISLNNQILLFSLIMNNSTISITVDKSEVNPLLLEQALYQLLEAFKIEILESEVSNITEEENKEFWG